MNTKRILQIVGIALLALLVVLGAVYAARSLNERVAEQPSENQPQETRENVLDATRAEVPEGTEVPELGATPADESIAVPISVTDALQGVSEVQLRTFLITAEGGKFTPSTVIVNQDDTVRIDFTAKDREYDITVPNYGLKQTAKQGETKLIEFRAEQTGKFTYFCELCGGLDSEAKGFIIVMP